MSGAGISADGTAEVERLTVRSKLEVAEMQINRLTAMEGGLVVDREWHGGARRTTRGAMGINHATQV